MIIIIDKCLICDNKMEEGDIVIYCAKAKVDVDIYHYNGETKVPIYRFGGKAKPKGGICMKCWNKITNQ
jgi:hypothetical protein